MIITNFEELSFDYDKVPTTEELKKIVNESIEESQSIRREAKRIKNCETTNFICYAIEDLEYLLQFFSANSYVFLNELAITRRKFLEIYIDLMWVYNIYLDDNNIAEELCKRFYQIGANDLITIQSRNKINRKDIYLGNENLINERIQNLEMVKKINLIELDPTNGKHKNSKLFKKDWRAHPKLFAQSKKMKNSILNTRDRIKMINIFIKDHFNIKNPPFLVDYDRLNQITHWTPFGLRIMSDDNKKIIYSRELNIVLGYLHDTLNLIFEYLNKEIPKSLAIIRQKFIWAS